MNGSCIHAYINTYQKSYFNFVFYDRLKDLMRTQVQDKFCMEWEKVVPRERLVYGDFMSG